MVIIIGPVRLGNVYYFIFFSSRGLKPVRNYTVGSSETRIILRYIPIYTPHCCNNNNNMYTYTLTLHCRRTRTGYTRALRPRRQDICFSILFLTVDDGKRFPGSAHLGVNELQLYHNICKRTALYSVRIMLLYFYIA